MPRDGLTGTFSLLSSFLLLETWCQDRTFIGNFQRVFRPFGHFPYCASHSRPPVRTVHVLREFSPNGMIDRHGIFLLS